VTYYRFYVENPLVEENVFRSMPREEAPLPTFAEARSLLPEPYWEGHDSTIACYWKVWELAFRNLRQPSPQSGFVANYIDTAFNDCLFMWDSAFILLFGRYGSRAFCFQRTLDNLYARQHPDGFICREIGQAEGDDRFHRFDPASTGPNVMPWTEWEYFCTFADCARLANVFPVLLAYHRWLREYHTWQDGTYWACGLASGMDNQPRVPPGRSAGLSHGHLSWIDACLQQILSARLLARMARTLGRMADVDDLLEEEARLVRFVNGQMWDDETAFYYDRHADGRLSTVKTVGAYWALLAGVVPEERVARFIGHLDNPAEFKRPHRVPSLSADHPEYRADGGYWLGGVWAPTNYMVLRGLTAAGADALAHEIALNHVENVVRVYEQTGTVWENYAPEAPQPGRPAKPDFVGWSGLPPTAVLLEYIFGLRPDVPKGRLVWDVRLLDAHGVSRYPFGAEGLLDLRCGRRSSPEEKPVIEARSTHPLVIEVRWAGGSETLQL